MEKHRTRSDSLCASKQAANVDSLRKAVEHAAELLPAQGPITAFVHHNTLHAFEDVSFEQGVLQGAQIFGCHPYLPESRYREKLAAGRIQPDDIDAILIDDLGDHADELLGMLGTRFHLRRAMLQFPLYTGPTEELRWVVAKTAALRKFRAEVSQTTRDSMIRETRRWVMRDLRNGRPADEGTVRARQLTESIFSRFDMPRIEQWDDATWKKFTLHLLWLTCWDGVRRAEISPSPPQTLLRHRDFLLEAGGEDSDRLVNELMIRFCGAFLDQGFAGWTLPAREDGFYRSFLEVYAQPGGPPDRWMRSLRSELQRVAELAPLESIDESLRLLGVDEGEQQEFISQTLLALRGFAGMIWQMETRADRAVRAAPEGSLIEFLAVRLILDRLALAHVARESLGYHGPLDALRPFARTRLPRREPVSIERKAFFVFQLAQFMGWNPQSLEGVPAGTWSKLLAEIDAFSGPERRRIYHEAFERRYRIETLDAVGVHCGRTRESAKDNRDGQAADGNGQPRDASEKAGDNGRPRGRRPVFQLICCIDEREESFRRHLEEAAPDAETLGAAGFYGVAMYYQGAADAHYSPLCPVIIKPQHYVREEVAFSFRDTEETRRQRRRTIGAFSYRLHLGSRTFAGGWLTSVLGALATLPLVMRVLFPRATAQLRKLFGRVMRPPAVTRLQLERVEETPGPEGGHVGYTADEMAAIVERLLRDMGLTSGFSRLVVVCGHGSSSLNNPHESAHDCGACAGGRGGPNARAFAQMANDPRVRASLAENGLHIPPDTYFVGAYHNTCDDSVIYYDLDNLPHTHEADMERAAEDIDEARARSAHERCRRFESAELTLNAKAALRHVEGRAEDLSQVRPEYGHATNALCFVGRREWSRGLFLDRRAFLQSYDPAQDDDEQTILTRILQAVIPVCAGISLEYYFSYVDPTGYGCGTKLPHNVASLLGVMNGAASDLRPGLPWQMVEIHDPVRLLFVIETTPEAMLQIMQRNEGIDRLVRGNWVQLATLDPATSQIHCFYRGQFRRHEPESQKLPQVDFSLDWYRGWRDDLGFTSVTAASPAFDRAPQQERKAVTATADK